MLHINQGLYVGKDNESGYIGYVAEDNSYVIMSIPDGMSKEQGKNLLEELREHINRLQKIILTSLDAEISEILVKSNVPLNLSMALGVVNNNILYLKTIGEGAVYLRRGKEFAEIISGENKASGYIREFDCVILTTSKFTDLLQHNEGIQKFIGYKKPKDIVNDLYSQDFGEDDRGVVSLFIEFVKQESITPASPFTKTTQEQTIIEEKDMSMLPENNETPSLENKISLIDRFKNNLASLKIGNDKRKTFTLLGVVIISIVLIWSVVLGRSRQVEAELQKKVQTTQEIVTQKLSEADEVAFLNLDRALALISEAKDEVNKLKNEVGNRKQKEVAELEGKINTQESKITKKEEKNFDEFYDLALEDKTASGSRLYLDGENVAILDNKNGALYFLSIAKKSIDKNTAGETKSASLVAAYEGKLYFYVKGKGIYQFTSDSKVKKVIDNDKDWKDIIDMDIYNGNIYVLDKEADEIYKYLVTEKGFSDKNSYFLSGESADLSESTSMSIDSSIYISAGNTIYKYTRGSKESIDTEFPEENVSITKLFTNADTEKLYAWDKKKGSIYILGKDGGYEREIKSSILAKADDFVVYDDAAYILIGQKIYKISL